MTVRRVVSVYLPTWPADRIRRRRGWRSGDPREPAILLVTVEHGKQVAASCCSRSAVQGVRPGMTLAEARSLLGRRPLIEAPHEPHRDATALRSLASWAIRFTPLVAPDPPDGLLLDVTGCARLYGSERRLINAIGNSLDRLGLANRLACARTIGCAWAVARHGAHERTIVAGGDERSILDPLPIESLRIDPETTQALHEVNVDFVGHALAIPRLEMAARFDGSLLRRIDQSLGEAAEIIDALEPPEPILAERVFDGALVGLEPLLIVSRELIDETAAMLAHAESGAMRLVMDVRRIDATPIRLLIRLSRPCRDAGHLWSLLRPRVESLNMGYGIEQITVSVPASQRIAHVQAAQWTDGRQPDGELTRAAGELIDTLSHRLGQERTLCMSVGESHCPERVARLAPAMTQWDAKPTHAAVTHEDRPSMLLDPPERIDVMAMTPEGPPIMLQWRGREHRLIAAHGPQRINCEWWRSGDGAASSWNRDYYKVQDETGRWLWMYRAVNWGGEFGGWFLHGQWA